MSNKSGWKTLPFKTITEAVALAKVTGQNPTELHLNNGYTVYLVGDWQIAQKADGTGPVKQRKFRSTSAIPRKHTRTARPHKPLLVQRPPYEGKRLASVPTRVKDWEGLADRWAGVPGAARYEVNALLYVMEDVTFVYWKDKNGKGWCVRVAPPLYPDSPALPTIPDGPKS